MANNNLYGYTPDSKKQKRENKTTEINNRLDRLNPYEFRKGMDFELTNLGCARLQESTPDERKIATETVLNNLEKHNAYYSALIQFESGMNHAGPINETSFNKFLESYTTERGDGMQEIQNSFKKGKMKDADHKNDKMESLKEAIKNEIKNILNENEDKEEKKASKGAKKTTKGIKALDKEAEKLKDQKKKLQAKIKPLVQDFNAKKIDRAKYDKKIGDIPKQIKDINKRLGKIEDEKDEILLKEKEDRRAVASTAMDRDVHRKLLEIIKEKGISLREGSENIRVYYEIDKLAYMEGLTAGLQNEE